MNQKLRELYLEKTEMLLSEWKAAFPNETAPCRINEFGILDEEQYQGILCVCRESNGWSNMDYERGVLFRPWLEDIVKHGLQERGHITRNPNMWYNLARWLSLIQEPGVDLNLLAVKKDLTPMRTSAFTNVNKIRGKTVSGKEFWMLAQFPQTIAVLRKEIEILQPHTILCGGTAEIVEKALPIDYHGRVLVMPHPGCRKSTVNLLQDLKKQL